MKGVGVVLLCAMAVAGPGAGCGRGRPEPSPSLSPAWQEVVLPTDSDSHLLLGDLAACADRWYAVGGYTGDEGAS